jgi:hypothetical protein
MAAATTARTVTRHKDFAAGMVRLRRASYHSKRSIRTGSRASGARRCLIPWRSTRRASQLSGLHRHSMRAPPWRPPWMWRLAARRCSRACMKSGLMAPTKCSVFTRLSSPHPLAPMALGCSPWTSGAASLCCLFYVPSRCAETRGATPPPPRPGSSGPRCVTAHWLGAGGRRVRRVRVQRTGDKGTNFSATKALPRNVGVSKLSSGHRSGDRHNTAVWNSGAVAQQKTHLTPRLLPECAQ